MTRDEYHPKHYILPGAQETIPLMTFLQNCRKGKARHYITLCRGCRNDDTKSQGPGGADGRSAPPSRTPRDGDMSGFPPSTDGQHDLPVCVCFHSKLHPMGSRSSSVASSSFPANREGPRRLLRRVSRRNTAYVRISSREKLTFPSA